MKETSNSTYTAEKLTDTNDCLDDLSDMLEKENPDDDMAALEAENEQEESGGKGGIVRLNSSLLIQVGTRNYTLLAVTSSNRFKVLGYYGNLANALRAGRMELLRRKIVEADKPVEVADLPALIDETIRQIEGTELLLYKAREVLTESSDVEKPIE